ncbi:AMP-binding protein [Streptomyces rubradiris]|uniref:AMP-binding protein n=1 Tax=Streptomyces rubradiris TaxID=285531 RepID=UPI0039B74CE9
MCRPPTTTFWRARASAGITLPDLRIGLVGGAGRRPRAVPVVPREFGVPLVDAYGSTETCGAITMTRREASASDGSCGLPCPAWMSASSTRRPAATCRPAPRARCGARPDVTPATTTNRRRPLPRSRRLVSHG